MQGLVFAPFNDTPSLGAHRIRYSISCRQAA